jgi:hypothetical protein
VPRITNAHILAKYQGKTFKTMTLEERKEFTAHIPWVKRLKEPQQCSGFVAKKTSLKHLYGTPEQRAQKPKCPNKALWKFTALRLTSQYFGVEDGIFCWNHLWSRGIHGTMGEDIRYEHWLIRVGLMKKR